MKKYDLYLTGTVGWSISAGYVKYVLDNKSGKPVSVAISSLGGNVDTGLQIYELFKNHGDVHVDFLGMSASAATFMAMGAKTVSMAKNALVLIHNSATWVDVYGDHNKESLDELIDRLKFTRNQLSTIDDVLAQIYADRNGKSVEDVKAKMKVAAWIKAEDAKDFGIVDEVIDAETVKDGVSNLYTNSLLNNMSLPPLPEGFNAQTGEENPAGIIQRAVDMLKGLIKPTAINSKNKMITIFKAVMAVLAIQDGFTPNDKGEIALSQDQMQKIEDALKEQEEACKQAKNLIESQKTKITDLQGQIETKDTEIQNLKDAAGETDNGGKAPEEKNSLSAAAELFNSIKDAM